MCELLVSPNLISSVRVDNFFPYFLVQTACIKSLQICLWS